MPPLPVSLLAFLMIGYPLVQIVAIRLRRPLRLRFNSRAERLKGDQSLSYFDRNLVNRIERRSRGGFDTLQRLLRLPVIAFESVFDDSDPMAQPTPRISDLDEVELLRDEASELEWTAWPITFLVVVPITFSAWALGAALAIVSKRTARPSLPSLLALVRAMIDDQRATA